MMPELQKLFCKDISTFIAQLLQNIITWKICPMTTYQNHARKHIKASSSADMFQLR